MNKEPTYDDEMVQFVNDEYERRQNERKPFELQWRLNKEFLDGNQYLDIDARTMTLQEIPRAYWYQEREVFNQISTITETRIARLNRSRPIMRVRPASHEEKDMSTAKVSSALLNASWFSQDMDEHYAHLIAWLELCGTVCVKSSWNTSKGRVLQKVPNPRKIMEEFENQQEEKKETSEESEDKTQDTKYDDLFNASPEVMEIKEGDIETSVVPPYEVFPDSSYYDNPNQIRSIIHARAYHVNEIEEMWGVKVEPEKCDVMTLQEMKSGLGGVGYSVAGFRGGNKSLKNHAVVKEYYERPSGKYPNGRFIVVASEKTLYAGPLPYKIGKDESPDFPILFIPSIPNPGCVWGKSVIERLIPLQRRYNALRNRKAEYLNLVSVGQWYEPLGSIDDDTELNNAPGNRIKFRPGVGQPEPVAFPSLPASFEEEIQTIYQEFTMVSGISELSRFAEAPSGVKSGVALSIANEQDDNKIAMTAVRIANAITQMGKHWLRLYKQFATEPRMIRNVGMEKEVEVMYWTASDLNSDDVIVSNSSELAETPAQRRQMVFDLINAGLFNRPEQSPWDEETRHKIFELLQFGHWEGGPNDERRLQISRAKRENQSLMRLDTNVHVMDFDDHEIHIQEHNRMRMQPEYDELLQTRMGLIVDELMRAHIAEHQRAILMQLESQVLQQQMLQGGMGAAQGGNQQQPPQEGEG